MSKVLIIAEAGVNHNGDINLAKKLIDSAADAGADIVKFQTFKAINLVTESAEMAEYQTKNTNKKESQYEMLKKLELSESEFLELNEYAKTKKIKFLSTGFDLESLKFLADLKMGIWKIPSGEITNLPYLEFVGKQNETVILSTGMCTISEIEDAVKVIVDSGTKRDSITILHCTTDYPTTYSDVNLNSMLSIEKQFGLRIGYSDHTSGIEISLAAVAMGAIVIEKHFTLDREMEGPDHKASLNPVELKQMVTAIRNIEMSFGSSIKQPTSNELENIKVARKSIIAKSDIMIGEVFSEINLSTKRPGTGISPMKLKDVYGKIAKQNFKKDELIIL